MPNIGKKEKLEARRASFQGEKRKRPRLWITSIGAGLLAGGLISYLYFHPGNTGSETVSLAGASGDSPMVLPVSTFEDGRARYYAQKDGDVEIRFFVIRSSDGVLRAAFDACDVCWRAGKGYAQDADHMVCRNCGLRFPSARVNEVRGGCNPSPLTRRVEDGNLIIEAKDIRLGKAYFDFGRRG
jgi:hypothetical protein